MLTAKETSTSGTSYTISSTFKVYFLSKPYLNRDLPDFSIRTKEIFSYTIPSDTFKQPNNLPLTYNVTNVPSWISLNKISLSLYGVPSNLQVGTFTIWIICTDTNGQNASTTFQISV
jgi:hypothetical protein